jgi:SAM-dependent methyltransferase
MLDFEAVKTRQQVVWSAGDYAVIGNTLQIVGERLCESMDVRPGGRLLDVAAGNGNVTLAAARRWCSVVSTDYVPALLEQGRRRAEAEGLEVEFRPADAENLPFPDESFDYVASAFGAMFAPDQDRAAVEMARVCRPGGKIGMSNWTPEGFVGKFFRLVGRFAPPPPALKSPALWGTEERLAELFGEHAVGMKVRRRHFAFRYKSPDHFIEVFSRYFGPVLKAFEGLDPVGRAEFAIELRGLLEAENRSSDGCLHIPGEYLEVVIVRGLGR